MLGERAGDRDPLLHAAGELVGVPVGEVCEPDELDELVGAGAPVGGVCPVQLQRQLGLARYETAWTMLQKLRRAMVRPERDRLSGTVELDETYLGGVEEGRRGGRQRDSKKSILAGPGMGLTTNEVAAAISSQIRADFTKVEGLSVMESLADSR